MSVKIRCFGNVMNKGINGLYQLYLNLNLNLINIKLFIKIETEIESKHHYNPIKTGETNKVG